MMVDPVTLAISTNHNSYYVYVISQADKKQDQDLKTSNQKQKAQKRIDIKDYFVKFLRTKHFVYIG